METVMDYEVTEEWVRYVVDFADLKQEQGWGSPRPETLSASALSTICSAPLCYEACAAAITDALGGGEGSIGTVAAGAGVRRSSAEAADVMNEACSSGAVKAASATRGTL
mgnify:CR=1 FL=1